MTMRLLRRTVTEVAGPVFFDASGKRWRHVIETMCAMTLALLVLAFWVTPKAFAPVWTEPLHQEVGFPRHFLGTDDIDVPIIGDTDKGVLTRVVQIQASGDVLNLVDPFSGTIHRAATEGEIEEIGTHQYVVEHYGAPAERQLMLTFDDGPDAVFTPQILDILAREKVPATFFVLGSNVVKNPDILKRIIREGHMVGNHTMSHTDFDTQTDIRSREELIGTDRVIRAVGAYASPLFRMPRGDPDGNIPALMQSQQLGYLHADYDMDTMDWSKPPGQPIPVPSLDGQGHVILLHDGGGDRTATVDMLSNLIKEAKSQGYVFSTMAPLLSTEYTPVKDITPSIADRATLHALQMVWVVPHKLLGWLFWLGVITLGTMSLFYLSLAIINHRRQMNRQWVQSPDKKMPHISVVIASYNEEKVIQRTISTLRESDYPQSKIEVIVVNDGSTDGSREVLDDYARRWAGLHVIHQRNGGKSSAINNGIANARPESEIIVTLDADTLFQRDTIRLMVRHFIWNSHRPYSKPLGAVAGHVKVGNRRNIITAWQSLEYISGICVTRLAEGMVNAIAIVPGACSAWSRSALEQIGGLSTDTLAEDADATLQLHRLGYRVVQENDAIAYTEAPETLHALSKQRLRWMYGNVQVLWKHRSMLLRPKYGMLGMVSLPYALLSLIIPLVFLPPTLIAAVFSLAAGNWISVVLFAVFVMTLHMVISIVAVMLARERAWHLLIVPIYRLIYEPLRAYLLYASLLRIMKGTAVGWNKLERLNSVTARPVD